MESTTYRWGTGGTCETGRNKPLHPPPPIKKRQHIHAKANQMAARIILADIKAWGGEDSLAVRWARAALKGVDDGQPSI